MNAETFQSNTEAHAEEANKLADELRVLNNQVRSDKHETKRYLALARTAAQESELWLGKAMVAFASEQLG